MFSISNSVRNSNEMQPCTPELLNAAMDSQQVADTCKEIADKLQQVKEGTLTREAFEAIKAKLKAENLPVVCFHATFTDILIRWLVVRWNWASIMLTYRPAKKVCDWYSRYHRA